MPAGLISYEAEHRTVGKLAKDNQDRDVHYFYSGDRRYSSARMNFSVSGGTPSGMYPFSRDELVYERPIRILSMYRLTLGQARQKELLEYLFRNCDDPDRLRELFINLSPFYKEKTKGELARHEDCDMECGTAKA